MKIFPSVFAGILTAILVNAGSLSSASAVITTWTASDDLYTTKSTNVVANEGSNRLLVGTTQIGYVRFTTGTTYSDLADIQSAVLRIYLPFTAQNPQTPVSVIATNILNTSDNWNDDGSNPAIGAVFTPGLGTLTSSTSVVGTNNPGIYFDWDVTSLVKSADAGLGNNIMSFRLDFNGSGTIRFAGTDHLSGNFPQLVVTSVPEPQTWVLLGLGLFFLVILRRRSRVS